MAFTKIAAAGIGSTELVTLHSLEVLNNATVGGVLTYEDVTNVDSIGIITARAGVLVGSGITLSKDGDIFATGVTTSTTFVGALTGNVTGNATGLSGTPNISAGTIAGSTGTFSGAISGTTGAFSQNIAIRLTSATNNLHVHQDDSDKSLLQFSNTTTGTTSGDGFQIGISGDEEAIIDMKETQPIIFSTDGSERLRINSDGRIAINDTGLASYTTHSPCLAIGDSGDSTPGLIIRGSATSNCDISFCDNSGSEDDDGVSEGLIRYEHSNDAMRFDTADSERLRISSSGELRVPAGIGAQLKFENQHSVTTDAAISTYDDADGTLLSLGSNFYFSSAGSETRYNTSEESSAIVLNRNGKITLKTGGTGATATTRLELDTVGSALFTNGIQIGVDEGSSSSGGLLIHRYSSTSIDDGTDFDVTITWPHSNTGAFMVECFSGHSHYRGSISYYKLVGMYGASSASTGGVDVTVIQETNTNSLSVSDTSNATQRGNSDNYSVTITGRSGQSATGTSIDSHVHVYIHSRVAPVSVTIG